MADISDVEQACADLVTSIVYPNGISGASIVGALCRVYRGWPSTQTLNTDLNAGAINLTVVSDNEPGRTTTRHLPVWHTTIIQPGVTVTTDGQQVTLSGEPHVGDLVGVLIDGTAYPYRVQDGDTAELVASHMNQLIGADRLSMVANATITIPGARLISARAVRDQNASFESRRQEKDLRIICWCPSPAMRDAIAAAIDGAFSQIAFLPLPDATSARILYRNTASYDQSQSASLYRRDLLYTAEFSTMATVSQPSLLFGSSTLNSNTTYG